MSMGQRIRKAREEARLTQTDLAEAAGSKQSNVFRWETGRAEPRAETLLKIAEATGVTINYLMGDFPHLPSNRKPMLVIPITQENPRTPKEASRLLYDDTGDDYYQTEFLNNYDNLLRDHWITWENGALVQWMEAPGGSPELERYYMYVK